MSTVVKWGLAAFAVWWVITQPSAAGAAVHHLATLATQAATSLATVISSI